jgi:hypothetical protein
VGGLCQFCKKEVCRHLDRELETPAVHVTKQSRRFIANVVCKMFIAAEKSYQECEWVPEHFERHLDRPWLLEKCCPTIRCQQAQTGSEKFSLAAYTTVIGS